MKTEIINKSENGRNQIGKTFTARKSFPNYGVGRKAEDEDKSYDVKVGEQILVKDFDGKFYTIENLSLGTGGLAWFKVDQEEFDYILRKGNTK